jgi:ABC-type transport system involved in cytochrome bd biosynthesis fused ATPase/permease subunit
VAILSDLGVIVLTAGMVVITAMACTLAVLVVSKALRQIKELVEMALVEQKQSVESRERASERIRQRREEEIRRVNEQQAKASHAEEDAGFDQPTHIM